MELGATTGRNLISIWTQSYNPAPECAIRGFVLDQHRNKIVPAERTQVRHDGRDMSWGTFALMSTPLAPCSDQERCRQWTIPKRPNEMEDMQAG
jgi:hypothetical protein